MLKKELHSLGYWALVLFILIVIHLSTIYDPEHISYFGSGLITGFIIIFIFKLLLFTWNWLNFKISQIAEDTDIRNQDR